MLALPFFTRNKISFVVLKSIHTTHFHWPNSFSLKASGWRLNSWTTKARKRLLNTRHGRLNAIAYAITQTPKLPSSDSSSTIKVTPQSPEPFTGYCTVLPQSKLWGIPQTPENTHVRGNFSHRIVVVVCGRVSPFMTHLMAGFVYHFLSFKGLSGYKRLLWG